MRLVTWNVNGLDDTGLDDRSEAAVFTTVLGATLADLQAGRAQPHEPPDLVVYQEVVERTLRAHFLPHLTAGGYCVHPAQPPGRSTFEIVAARPPYAVRSFEAVPLTDSIFGRHLTLAEVDGPGGTFRLLTGHFDSGTENGTRRLGQLSQTVAAMDERSVFAGDANLRKAEWISARDTIGVTDAWEDLGEPASTRVTWRRHTDGEEFKARFDRVLLGRAWRACSMTPLGATPPKGATPISDHIGLLVEIESVG